MRKAVAIGLGVFRQVEYFSGEKEKEREREKTEAFLMIAITNVISV
jgi:hypothetical protein